MARLDIISIEDGLRDLVAELDAASFLYDFLGLYDIPKSTVTKLRKEGGTSIKNKLHYEQVAVGSSCANRVHQIEQELAGVKSRPRYIIVTDFVQLAAKDLKTADTLSIAFGELPSYADFFLAWNGIEKVDYARENPADIKAAERFTRLYDELRQINQFDDQTTEEKEFNLFLIRLLFLLFAEDTGIMGKSILTNAIKTRTQEDGSDLTDFFNQVFASLDRWDRRGEPDWLSAFPYVNGKLFTDAGTALQFDRKTRKLIIEAGELLNWDEINPDILGAMIQTVANKELRASAGMHYTSVPNIMKVIKPLFLDSLRATYEGIVEAINANEDKSVTDRTRRDNRRLYEDKLEALLARLSAIRFFDPACGSGNFLIITYKEMRRLEIDLLRTLRDLRGDYSISLFERSAISLNQFYGIELDDFAHEVARLSLWIAEHQMNVEMKNHLNFQPALLPLKDAGNITQGNALRLDWNAIVPHTADDEIYLIGNPPYIGAKGKNPQSPEQKEELQNIIYPLTAKNIDYIFGWFIKASRFIKDKNMGFAFVSTNSIFQGEQASFFSQNVLDRLEIRFAYPSIMWSNSSKNKASVTVSIVGLGLKSNFPKILFTENDRIFVEQINSYLRAGEDYQITKRRQPLSDLPENMTKGSVEIGGNNLVLTIEEYQNLIKMYPQSTKLCKKIINATDLMNRTYSYALWIEDDLLEEAMSIPEVRRRVAAVETFRKNTTAKSASLVASTPWKFGQNKHKELPAVVFPVHSSASREYLPVDYIEVGVIVTTANCLIFDAPLWLIAVLSSKMHICWLREAGSTIKTDLRYSVDIVYNTFPIPKISEKKKVVLEELAMELLGLREELGGNLASLYGGRNKPMHPELKEIHLQIDEVIDSIYGKSFSSDDERTQHLIKLYKEMVG